MRDDFHSRSFFFVCVRDTTLARLDLGMATRRRERARARRRWVRRRACAHRLARRGVSLASHSAGSVRARDGGGGAVPGAVRSRDPRMRRRRSARGLENGLVIKMDDDASSRSRNHPKSLMPPMLSEKGLPRRPPDSPAGARREDCSIWPLYAPTRDR